MTDPIKALIDAAERAWDIYRVDPSPVFLVSDSMEGLSKAVAAAKAAAEARPEPKPVRHCAKCGKPENAHDARHPFVGTGEPIRPEPAAEPSEVAKLIHQGHEFLNASAVLPAVRAALRALEALVREVRE